MPDQPPTFGRILVRVVLAEPRQDRAEAAPVFQRLYAPEASLRLIAWDAFSHYAARVPDLSDDYFDAVLHAGAREVARLVPTSKTSLGDYLNLHTSDQTTLGTVQFELRCVAMPKNLPIMTR